MSKQNIWVFFELSDGRPKRVCLEMMQKAKELAEGSSEKAVAVIIDPEPEEAARAAFEYGADQVLTVRQKFFFESAAYILEKLAEKYEPRIVMIGATTEGRDLAAAASVRLHAGIASECTDVVITGSGVFWIRPSYDGKLNTNISIEEAPMIGTFKPGIFRLGEPAVGRNGETVEETVDVPAGVLLTQLLGFTPDDELTKANIEDAEIIIAGGRGVGSREGFDQLYELAAALGGSVGASRAAVDEGWIGKDYQIGITGKTVAPRLYIGFGISGALPHVNGMKESDIIVAVNTDPNAPIFSVANYGIVADLNIICPALTRKILEMKG
ncbi:MAG: electron transfer flavoprotein subunit alpha/FixB family protein [Lachnospiraceae bacterium]|nr:electron transfer flavoprotein subunit alpha/FixB family protein [Lachnospiraceae bacterium]MEE1165092.1 electron transfer flavoprotein subunit alpha/FixB family protein [Lachnospiraceae bacterium]